MSLGVAASLACSGVLDLEDDQSADTASGPAMAEEGSDAGDGDGVIRQGRAALVAAAELPSQRALVVALELQEAAVEASGDDGEDEDG